jgi:lipopolysaccharide/colanic/teichoic acid biosynthesis glycosyltransferase
MSNTTPLIKKGLPRFVEILLALCGILITLPLLLISAVLIKITSRGAVLFRQKRVGRNGREFTLYKLRTMRSGNKGLLITAATDRRITSLGKFLRKTKIDELPELWNVLRGDMSFVGPRPEVPQLVDLNEPHWQEILQVRPGITDPVTLRLRNEELLLAKVMDKEAFYREVLQPYKLNGYAKFIKRRTWKTDIIVICQTIRAILLPKSAPPPTVEEVRWSFVE